MSFDIVMITTMSRLDLLEQSLQSLADNAASDAHSLTLVLDNPEMFPYKRGSQSPGMKVIINTSQCGASRSRNIGASSIPKYRRQEYVCFFDDDVFAAKLWDKRLEEVLAFDEGLIVSGSAHPYNHGTGDYDVNGVRFESAGVLSTVNMAMRWNIFDECGPWDEPGGSGASEDVAFCSRAVKSGYGLAVTSPHAILHCGEHSSTGNPIVGIDLVQELNRRLVKEYGLEGKVQFG